MITKHREIESTMRAQIYDWLHEHETQEGVLFDVSLIAMPSPQPGAFQPALILVLQIPGAVLTEPMFSTSISFNLSPDNEQLGNSLAVMLEGMRNERSKLLAAAGEGHAQSNGSRIILPGQ